MKGLDFTPFLIILIILIVLVVILFFVFSYMSYRIAFGYSKELDIPPHTLPTGEQYKPLHPQMTKLISDALKIPYEEVYIKSFDGLRLFGRYYETAKGAPVQMLFHGYRSNAIRDFSGGLQFYLNLGFNVLLVDQRAHGQSEGKSIAFGVLERYDCLEWVKYIEKRCGGDVPIIITGLSMGAATVLMASDLELPKNVVGILADCGYSTPKDIIRKVIKEMRYPLAPTYFFVRMGGIIYGGFDIEKSSAQMSLKKTDIPVLLVHGEDDRFVPCEMSRQNKSVCKSDCQILTVKNAAHGVSYLVDQDSYCDAVKAFFKRVKAIK